jgi:hypothetical protein
MRKLTSILAAGLLLLPITSSRATKTVNDNVIMEGFYTPDKKAYLCEFDIVVQKGDNLTKIAQRINHLLDESQCYNPYYKVTAKSIFEVNNEIRGADTIINPNLIFPGQRLRYRISHIPQDEGI